MIEEIFDWFGEQLSAIGEFFGSLFEGFGEFSTIGVIYGIIMVVLCYVFRKSVFFFVNTMQPAPRVFWTFIFYIVAFFAGYIMGKRVWRD